jgi:hypothetical protein
MKALHHVMANVGFEELGGLLKKSPQALRNGTVPTVSDNTHKAGFDESLTAMYIANDFAPLEIFLDEVDKIIVDREKPEDLADQAAFWFRLLAESGQLVSVLSQVLEDGEVDEGERRMVSPILRTVEQKLAAANQRTKDGKGE